VIVCVALAGRALFVPAWLWRVLGNATVLLLTVSAAALVVACHWAARDGPQRFHLRVRHWRRNPEKAGSDR
jgi:hypothetical protein